MINFRKTHFHKFHSAKAPNTQGGNHLKVDLEFSVKKYFSSSYSSYIQLAFSHEYDDDNDEELGSDEYDDDMMTLIISI